jgi:hypothetical protein
MRIPILLQVGNSPPTDGMRSITSLLGKQPDDFANVFR